MAKWWLYTAVGVTLAVVGFGGVWCWRSWESALTSGLVCSEPIKDLGETGRLEHTHDFELVNTGSVPVKITTLGRPCACLSTELSNSLVGPGESAMLTVKVDVQPQTPGVRNRFAASAFVHTEGREDPALELRLQGTYVPPAYRLKREIMIVAPSDIGESYQAEFELYLNREERVQVTGFETQGALDFDAAIKRRHLVEGQPFECVVFGISGILRANVRLPERGRLLIRTNSRDLPEISVPVALRKSKTELVTYTPQRVAFGVLEAQKGGKGTVTFRWPSTAQYVLKEARASGEGIAVRAGAVEEDAGQTVLTIECEPDTATLEGAITQHLVVELECRKRLETYKVPISGFVKAKRL